MTIRQATPADSALIHDLAVPAWRVAYGDILSEEQFAYMIEKMYSGESIHRQMQSGHVFFIAYLDECEPVGFISLNKVSAGSYILEKLYVLPLNHKTGAGRFLVEKPKNISGLFIPDKICCSN